MIRAWFTRAVGLFAGASIAALLSALCGGQDHSFAALLLPLTAGDWLLAAGLCLLMSVLCGVKRLAPRLGGGGLWCAVGLGAGIIPVPLQFGWQEPLAIAAGAAAAALIVFLAWRRPPAVRPFIPGAIVLLTPVWCLATGFYHDSTLHKQLNLLSEARLRLPALGAASPAPPAGAPDVYLISIDTLRADALVGPRPAGYELPFLDALRQSGTGWDYALSSSNQTVPGHAGMLLGRDAMGTGVRWNHDSLPNAESGAMLAERFKAAGFRTAAVISNGLLHHAGHFDRGCEIYDDTTVAGRGAVARPLAYLERSSWLGLLLDPRVVERFLTETLYFSSTKPYRSFGKSGLLERGAVTSGLALAALDQLYAQPRPFFCFLHYMDPHQPYGAPAPYAGRLTKDLPPYAARYRPTARQGMFALAEIDQAARDLRSDDPQIRAEAELAMRWFHLTYLEKLMFMDAQIQRVHERAAASGRPAVWLVTADHGEHFGEHGVVLHGTSLYEELVRVPMILAGPGVAAGQRGSGVPHLEDVAPTLLALAGLVPPDELKGRILSREGAAGADAPHVAADNRRIAVRADGWKLHGFWDGKSQVKPGQLFHLAEDGAELKALAADAGPPSLLALLAEFLARDLYSKRTDLDRPDYALDKMLNELGYVTGLIEQ